MYIERFKVCSVDWKPGFDETCVEKVGPTFVDVGPMFVDIGP